MDEARGAERHAGKGRFFKQQATHNEAAASHRVSINHQRGKHRDAADAHREAFELHRDAATTARRAEMSA